MEKNINDQQPFEGQLYYKVTYYNENEYQKDIMLITSNDLNDFYRGKLDFLIGIADDGEHFSINGAMIYTIKQIYNS